MASLPYSMAFCHLVLLSSVLHNQADGEWPGLRRWTHLFSLFFVPSSLSQVPPLLMTRWRHEGWVVAWGEIHFPEVLLARTERTRCHSKMETVGGDCVSQLSLAKFSRCLCSSIHESCPVPYWALHHLLDEKQAFAQQRWIANKIRQCFLLTDLKCLHNNTHTCFMSLRCP